MTFMQTTVVKEMFNIIKDFGLAHFGVEKKTSQQISRLP